jgi:hypothetical protein
MPTSPKLRPRRELPSATPEGPNYVQRIQKVFRVRGQRKRFILLSLALICLYYFAINDRREQYDLSFLEDDDEDIIPKKDHDNNIHGSSRKHRSTKGGDGYSNASTTESMEGFVHVEEQEGLHPLYQVIAQAEKEWETSMDARPSSVSS